MSVSTPSITPLNGEGYRPFVVRAHQALMPTMRDPDTRNKAVWSAWASVHGDPLAERAQSQFPADKYRLVPAVCYFYEHETIGSDGQPVKYSIDSLSDIVAEHNEREDTANYTAITNGHTAPRGAPESMQPRVVGYAGPYRLGMVGYDKPKYAVFADEHHERNELPTINRKRRRSVEINRFKNGRRPYFDPVAILGSESPRLALPVAQYQEGDAIVDRYVTDGVSLVERYEGASCASGSNTFLPSADSIRDRHSMESQPVNADPNANDQDALVARLVQAFLSTPEMVYVRSQMQAAQGQGQPQPGATGQPAPTPGGQPPAQSPPVPPAAPALPDPSPQPGAAPSPGPSAPSFPGANGQDEDEDQGDSKSMYQEDQAIVERFALLSDEHNALTEKYSRLEEVNQANMQQIGTLNKAVIQLEQRALDADRTIRIKDLYQQYPHFIEVDAEMDTCLYSHGASMDNDQFERHIKQVEGYAKKSSPVTAMLPGGNAEPTKELYSEEFSQQVIDKYTELANAGQHYSYDQVAAMVREGK